MISDRHRAILEFERTPWRYVGAKDSEALARFSLSGPRYYQTLDWLLDQPETLAYDPVLVGRLRRLREKRRHARVGKKPPPDPS